MRHLARLLAILAALSPALASSAVLQVRPGESIQAALDAALPGDTVQLDSGTYYERIQLVDAVDLVAAVPGSVTVDGEAEGSVVVAAEVGPTTRIVGIRFQNGSALQGGGLRAVASSPQFDQCTFANSAAVSGGGVYLAQGAGATFTNCRFENNQALVGGGLYLDFSRVTVLTATVSGNVSEADGAAISANNAAEATFTDVCIVGNRARAGGVISCTYASPQFTSCTIAANLDDAAAGTFVLRGSGTRIDLCVIAFNAGPALTCDTSSPWIGCTDLFGNLDDTICAGDQGTNLAVDPLFCNLAGDDYNLQATSPLLATPCGALGAHLGTCPGVSTPAETRAWSAVKRLYRPRAAEHGSR